ncbi:MAG TPA: DGQHR domain-containing protein [Allosphingosinicella sp.]|jgi:DGQHR domain-containing protein
MINARVIGHVEENRIYQAALTPPKAKELFFVSTYNSADPLSNAFDKHGYQRPPSPERFAEIGRYYAEGNNRHKIPPIIISVRLSDPVEIKRFLKLLDAGDIDGIKAAFGAFVASVIDGQHRFHGLIAAWAKDAEFLPQIPCTLYFGLSFIEEATMFNTINATQRKLPKALIETTRGDITEAADSTYAQQIRRITFSLCRDDGSVWGPIDGIEQINMTGVRDPNRQVTYEGLRRSTSNMFPVQLLSRLSAIDEHLPLKYAKRYWAAVAKACVEAWNGMPEKRTVVDPDTGVVTFEKIKYRIKDLVGVASLAKLGKDVITTHIDSGKATKLEELVDNLAVVDWEKSPTNKWMRSQAGFAGQKELYTLLYELAYNGAEPESTDFGELEGEVLEDA